MTDYLTWESWPGYTDDTKFMLNSVASLVYDDCQGLADIIDELGFPTGDRILIRGTMSRPVGFSWAQELLEEVG